MNRRVFLGSSGAALLTGCRRAAPPEVSVLGLSEMALGHKVWARPTTWSAVPSRTAVLIIGAGVAGLSAAWRLRRGGFTGEIPLLELGTSLGGTAGSSGLGERRCPLGAHYVTLPNPENLPMRRMLQDFGVIEGFAGERPRYREDMLCAAPEERLFFRGRWEEGLFPSAASPEDQRQHLAFQALMRAWTTRVGADGRPAFSIPVALSSRDPEVLALAQESFSDWLDRQGFTAPGLRWWLEYGTRDDYGTLLGETSAWAGLHYHCARRPDPADDPGTDVLTWPAGNGWLVDRLASAAKVTPRFQALVRSVTARDDGVEVWVEVEGIEHSVVAEHVVLAVPSAVAARLLGSPLPQTRATPWEVVNLFVPRLPVPRLGLGSAWDSVIHGSESLGYVHAGHQLARTTGPTVLTWYRPWTGDPTQTRLALAREDGRPSADRAITEMVRVHPDLEVEAAIVQIWGHGTLRPEPGVVPPTHAAPPVHPRVHLAHTDRSGLSLFEEACWHGVVAAETLLRARGALSDEVLANVDG